MLAVILIVNWNGMAWLERCLASVFKQPLDESRVVVVDNGSTDGSAESVSVHFPQVDLIRLARNVGFAAANNIAIAQTASRYVITLNNDTEVGAGWLSFLIDAAEADAAIGSCASRIVLANPPHV